MTRITGVTVPSEDGVVPDVPSPAAVVFCCPADNLVWLLMTGAEQIYSMSPIVAMALGTALRDFGAKTLAKEKL